MCAVYASEKRIYRTESRLYLAKLKHMKLLLGVAVNN